MWEGRGQVGAGAELQRQEERLTKPGWVCSVSAPEGREPQDKKG